MLENEMSRAHPQVKGTTVPVSHELVDAIHNLPKSISELETGSSANPVLKQQSFGLVRIPQAVIQSVEDLAGMATAEEQPNKQSTNIKKALDDFVYSVNKPEGIEVLSPSPTGSGSWKPLTPEQGKGYEAYRKLYNQLEANLRNIALEESKNLTVAERRKLHEQREKAEKLRCDLDQQLYSSESVREAIRNGIVYLGDKP
jgi:hypothetical protein